MKHLLIILCFCLNYFTVFSQQITAKLIDKNTGNPIPFATIKTGEFSGVISNEEGYFTVNLETQLKSVIISCLGYENKKMSLQAIKNTNHVIEMEEAINQLSEVFISNKKPNADSIIARVNVRITDNYNSNLNKFNIFHRTTDYVDFKSLDFEIEKASHVKKKNLESANGNLQDLSNRIRKSDIKHFTDFKGTLYNFNKDSSKLTVHKATKLIDSKNDFSIDDIQNKAQNIVLTYLDTTKTYKLKTGLFKIEDSLSLKDDDFKDDRKNEFDVPQLNTDTRSLLRHAQFYKNSFLSRILNPENYEYAFVNTIYNNGELTYVIRFMPRKGKSKYTGKLFVSDSSYAITKIDYAYYKNRHGKKLNLKLLLGVKFILNISQGTILFEKSSDNTYQPKYINRISGSYFYVNRDVKFIENSRARNKVGFSFKIEGDNRNKEELLITKNTKLSENEFTTITQDSIAPYTLLGKFEKTIWENEETLEPLQDMKAFEAVD